MIVQCSKGINANFSVMTASVCAMALLWWGAVMAASHEAQGLHEGQPGAMGAKQQDADPMVITTSKGALGGGYRASEWIDKAVKNHQGDTLGKVEELVIAPSGRVHYVAISASDALGLSQDELIVVPWSAIEPAAAGERLTLNLEKGRLAQAPRFKRGQWPDTADPEWNALVVTFYELAPAQPSFSALDANDNGEISEDEAQGRMLSGDFEQFDINDDGQLNRSEFSAFEERRSAHHQQQERQPRKESEQFNTLPKQEYIGVPGQEDR